MDETEGYPCNPNLDTSTSSSSNNNNNFGSGSSNINNPFLILTPPPTPGPTTLAETPSLISGAIWFDSNGDGLKNTIQTALTTPDREAALEERGAGVGNVKVTLRRCEDDLLLGVTYTFPRQMSSSVGSGGESGLSGGVQIVDSDYLAEITTQLQFGSNNGPVSELGYGNVNNELGYYSFRVLPSYLPGNFYVVFEAPEGYRLSGGGGDFWEVQEAELYDPVEPVFKADWDNKHDEDEENGRYLQDIIDLNDIIFNNTEETTINSNVTDLETESNEVKVGPINHSGYYARSKGCLFIQESPTTISNINCGLSKDSWPLNSFQYASFVMVVEFFDISRMRRRKLQAVDSLECRKYQKLKGEGVDIEDIWGCETPLDVGGGSQFEFAELTIEQADLVITSLNDFLLLRAPRAWSIENVHLVWQNVVEYDVDNDDGRRLGSTYFENNHRGLQNQQLAQLELGIRVRAEFQSDRAETQDLAEVVMASIDANPTTLLSTLKANVNVMPPYFRIAGALTMRRIMWRPPTPSPTLAPSADSFPNSTVVVVAPSTPPPAPEIIGGTQLFMIIGIVSVLVALVAGVGIGVGMHFWKKRKTQIQLEARKLGMEDGYDDDSLSSRWYSDYEGSNKEDDDLTDYAAEDSFGEFDESGPISNIGNLESMRGSMRVSFRESPRNGSMRSSFRSQRSSGLQSSKSGRSSQRSAAMSSMRSSAASSRSLRSTAMSSMRSSAASSRSLRSAAMSSRSMRSSAASSRSMRSMRSSAASSRSLKSAAMSSRSMRSSAVSSRSMHSSGKLSSRSSGDFSSGRSSGLSPIT